MIQNIFELLGALCAVILFLWSVVLVWASWQVRGLLRELAKEREGLRRWSRLRELQKRQNGQWQ